MLSCTQDSDKRLSETECEYHDAMLGFKIALINLFLHKTSHYKHKLYAACLTLPKAARSKEIIHSYFADFLILSTDLTHLRLLLKASTIYDNQRVCTVLSMLVEELGLSHHKEGIAHYWHDPMQDYYRLIGEAARIKRAGLYLYAYKNNLTGQDVIEISRMIHQGATAFGESICRHTLDYQPLIVVHDEVKDKLKLSDFKAAPKISQVILDSLGAINNMLLDKIPKLSSDSHWSGTKINKNINKPLQVDMLNLKMICLTAVEGS